jgi:hypothetical protein
MRITRTSKRTNTNATPGFAIEIQDDTQLGLAILIAEFGDGSHQPVGVVVSINEAREIAEGNMRGRMRDLEAGGAPACPETYTVWAQGLDGEYRIARKLPA